MRDLRNKSVTGPAAETLNLSSHRRSLGSNNASPSPDKKNHLRVPVLDSKTQKKLFGKLSIQDVALFTRSGGDSELGLIEGYQVDSKLRFNFPNKDFKVPPSKLNRYIDQLMTEKAKIPSPDKYAPIRANFNDIKKKKRNFPKGQRFVI